jgi:hypothetical protein
VTVKTFVPAVKTFAAAVGNAAAHVAKNSLQGGR